VKRKLGFMATLLFSSLLVAAQDRYDTLLTWHYYAKYPPDPEKTFILVRKDISYYNAKGRLSMVKGFEYTQGNPNPYFFYEETYNYAANDSLLSIYIYEVPRGERAFKWKELVQYIYKGSQLQEIKTTKYALTYGEKLLNQREARERWGSISDTSGWTATSATRFSYDDQGRLTKKGIYVDYADRSPTTMWLYAYGNDFPDINSYYHKAYTLKMVYNHLYKNNRLVTYREEKLAGNIEIETYDYSYNKEGNLAELVISHSEMVSKNLFGPYKKDGKEDVSHRTEYRYKNGRLASKEVNYKDSYTKYKVKFIDRIGNMPSVSTSTTGYGDYQRTTTTVTPSTQPPPSKEDMIAKTKYKWKKYTVEYEYLPDGTQIVKGSTPSSPDDRFDSKGRLKVGGYCENKELFDGRPTCVRWEYKYRN
jgi:hypothetical protein